MCLHITGDVPKHVLRLVLISLVYVYFYFYIIALELQ